MSPSPTVVMRSSTDPARNSSRMREIDHNSNTQEITSPEKYVDGHRVYGFILVMGEDNSPDVSHVFGVCKKQINIGRGSKNDIRLNARMFSRLHVTLAVTEEEEGARIKVSYFGITIFSIFLDSCFTSPTSFLGGTDK